ncbi:MAG: hypothetical protein ACYC8T_21485 [Myxococcaceae bacterium]
MKASPHPAEVAESQESAASGTEGSESGVFSHEELAEALEKNSEAWAPDNAHEDREEKLSRDEEAARKERLEGKDAPQKPGEKQGHKGTLPGKAQTQAKPGPSDGFERGADPLKQALQQPMRTAAAMAARAVAAALPPPPSAPRPGKPPDAMTLLHSAKDAGVYFKEDSHHEGHSEEQDDPELAAAVEEAIRLLFGVRGIHRVGPGKNEAGEPVVLVVANRGFGETSMKSVPPRVHRFPTLLALPYELLPLRRER